MIEAEKPQPVPDDVTRGYWEALKTQRVLAIQWCLACEAFQHFPEPNCGACGGTELSFKPVSGSGRVYSYVITEHAVVPGFAPDVPFVIAWIELVEQPGLRVLTNLVNIDVEEVHIGMAVRLVLEDRGDWTIPQFAGTSGNKGIGRVSTKGAGLNAEV